MRRRFKQMTSVKERLPERVRKLRDEANHHPHGPARDATLRTARQIALAAHIDDWLGSPRPSAAEKGHSGSALMKIKIRQRSRFPKPWRWEIYVGLTNPLPPKRSTPRSKGYARPHR